MYFLYRSLKFDLKLVGVIVSPKNDLRKSQRLCIRFIVEMAKSGKSFLKRLNEVSTREIRLATKSPEGRLC